MSTKPKPGTYGAITRSTEEEHKKFMEALKGLHVTQEEFARLGPASVFMHYAKVMKKLRQI
jgi:hypothetical protein